MSLRNRILVLVAGALALGAVLFAATSMGRVSSSQRSGGTSTLHPRAERPTVSAAAKSSGATVRYVESADDTVGPGAIGGFSFKCPKKAPRAVSGYGGASDEASNGRVVLSDSVPFKGGRHWSVGVKNLSDQPAKYYVGIVCVG